MEMTLRMRYLSEDKLFSTCSSKGLARAHHLANMARYPLVQYRQREQSQALSSLPSGHDTCMGWQLPIEVDILPTAETVSSSLASFESSVQLTFVTRAIV
jgi:hypothetical protein